MAAAQLRLWEGVAFVMTKQKPVTRACAPACTAHRLLPRAYPQPELPQSSLPTQTHAPGRLLSRAGTRAPFPPWRTITLAVGFALREWCQPRGLACNSPLLQAGVRTHTLVLNPFSQHCSTRWMVNRDARRSKSPPAAGRYSPAAAAGAAIRNLLPVIASLLKQSKLFFDRATINRVLSERARIAVLFLASASLCVGQAACYAPFDNG